MSEASKIFKGRKSKEQLFELMEKLEEAGCDPILELASIAMDNNVPIDIRARTLKELAGFVYPKRRSMEIGNMDEEGLVVKIKKFSDADLAASKFTEEGKKDHGKEEA